MNVKWAVCVCVCVCVCQQHTFAVFALVVHSEVQQRQEVVVVQENFMSRLLKGHVHVWGTQNTLEHTRFLLMTAVTTAATNSYFNRQSMWWLL